MSCYHPLTAIWTGCYTEKNKKDYVIVSGEVDKMPLDTFRRMFKARDYTDAALKFDTDTMQYSFRDLLPVPCGRCIGCRLDYSRQWAVRCLLEAKEYTDNYFITLTYDDAFLPKDNSVHKRELQLFIKRLRKRMCMSNIRYYACGEYGSKNNRPHYHIIFFNLPLNDKKFLSCTNGNKLFISDTIAKCWPYGFHTIGDVNFETAAYTARYVMKKHKGLTAVYYDVHKIEPEFVLMSRMPGIGLKYFEEHKDLIYSTDEVIYANSANQPVAIKPSSYYDKKYDIDNAEHLKLIKEVRTFKAITHRANVLKNNGFSSEREYLDHEEQMKKESCKILKRVI